MIASKVSAGNRKRKYLHFLQVINPTKDDKILDVGFNNDDSPNENYLEKHYPYLSQLTALGINSDNLFKQRYPEVNTVIYDGNVFPFADNSFDIGWSNAVIEHVGNWQKQILFVKELNRVCKKIYFTTPNRYFPFETHTRLPLVHWFPKRICDAIYSRLGLHWATGDNINLFSERKLKKLLKQAGIEFYNIKKNRFCGFVIDFCVVIVKG